MNFYADSSYIHAKIYALHSLLLTRKDYYEMARSGNFNAVAAGLNAGNIKNDYTELKESLFDSQIKLVVSLAEASVSYSRVFILFLRYFEMLNLKTLYAKAFGRMPSPMVWYNTGEFAVLDREMLSENTDVAALFKYTTNTWMRDILTVDSAGTFEEVEFLIDRAALRLAAEFPNSMSFSRGADSMKIVSGLAAYFRLAWSWRLQHIYAWDEGSTMRYIESNVYIPRAFGFAMRSSVEEWERFLLMQVKNNYVDVVAGGGAGILSAEKVMERVLLRDFSRTFHENFHSINTVICYLALLYRQIRNLFTIIDGLRFGLEPDMIMDDIICEG
ncbi:MAG TPA: V-type ATPase subunit [Spirochaetota bacterium]|nr:V-type ATPase subunit [Spirochaetota bacterium]HPJ34247.1 V-type ATPase subunit [Spirochaetota bacterium]